MAERTALLLPDPIADMAIRYSKHLVACQKGELPHTVTLLKDELLYFFRAKQLSPLDREGIYRCLINKGMFNMDGTTKTLTYPWSNQMSPPHAHFTVVSAAVLRSRARTLPLICGRYGAFPRGRRHEGRRSWGGLNARAGRGWPPRAFHASPRSVWPAAS